MSTQEDEHAKLLAQANYELSVYGQISEDTADSLADYDSGVKGLSKATKQAYQGVKKLGEAVGKTATAMYEGKEGASAYNGALDSMGDAADNASKALFMLGGPFGMIAGAIAFLIGKAIKATKVVNEQLDNEYKAFQALGKSGAAASDGMTGAFEGMQKLRLGVQDFQKYGELIGQNAKELATFGGTVFEGRKKLENTSAALEPYRLSLNRLGMTQDAQNEGLTAFIVSETRMGRAQKKTSDQLAEGAVAYLKEQDALTKATGVERADREKARAEALKEQGYAAKLRSLQLNHQDQAVKNFESVNEMMTSLNPEAAKAVRAAMAGNLSSAEAQKVFGSSAGKVMELNEKLEKNLIQPAEYAQEIDDIVHDIQIILDENNGKVDAETIRAIVVVSQINLHIWHNESNYRRGISDGNNLELTHGLNGIRNTAKNKIQEVIGGRKDYKVDCLAANFKDWEISWAKKNEDAQ